MPSFYHKSRSNVLSLPSQKLLLNLSLDDLSEFVRGLDMEELTELLRFYEKKEYFEACIVVSNYMKNEKKTIPATMC